ncbi:MAG TPA: HD-GYP domain-containing protein [Clostridiales bacterium]|nr:HD-GYP domain-containing protein [Clostridiales bacterium]
MKRKYIHIYQCKPGYILADDAVDENGILIVSKGTMINEHIIKRLIDFRIRQISVYDDKQVDNNEIKKEQIAHLRRDYKKNINVMKQLINDLAAGKKLDFEKVKFVSDSVYYRISTITNLTEYMNAVKDIDVYTYRHSINVSIYAYFIAKWLGMEESEIKNVITTGILHDIGKSRIPDSILNKRGPLLPEEFEKMKEHVEIGYKLSLDIKCINDNIREGVLMHHENVDGSGYPYSLKGDKINLYAKIISVADVYDALTSERVYKKRNTPFDAFKEIIKMGYSKFDPKILTTFLTNIYVYYIGSMVKMNNGQIGQVVFVSPLRITAPIVSVGGRCIDLSEKKYFRIDEML